MKKLIVIGLLTIGLFGCEKTSEDISTNFILPEGLEDCSVFKINGGDGDQLKIVRCPNSSTSSTYRSGKVTRTNVVVDGVEYIKK